MPFCDGRESVCIVIYSEINRTGLRGTHRHLKAFKLSSSMPPRKIGMAPSVKYTASQSMTRAAAETTVKESAENTIKETITLYVLFLQS